MPLHAFGLNHQTAPVALREKLAYSAGELDRALAELKALPGVAEAAVVSTCNRTEVYAELAPGAQARVIEWLGRESGAGPALEGYLYRHGEADAVRHLFRVATGLDSLVLGEPQVLGQVKEAWHAARAAGALKSPLDRLFQQAFAVAKRVRTDTRIGAHPVSVAFAAVRLARQRFTDLEQATVLLVGAGDTIELAARHLADANVKGLLVANRTVEHAHVLAQRHGGFALPLTDLARHLPEADIVLSATASREPIIGVAQVREALKARRHRPMLFLDLAVPRDIDPAVGKLGDAYLYTVDDLEQAVEENRASRREAAAQAEAIIDLQVEHFMAWWAAQGRQDALRRMRADAEAHREALLAKARAQVAAGEPAEAVLERLAHQLTNKLLHAPSSALRQAALDGDADLLRAAERLYIAEPKASDDDAGPAPQA
jgi:glutamyl-tRNA reductase